MPRFRRRVVRRTMGKEPRVMTGSIITSSTDGGINEAEIVKPTEVVGTVGTGHAFEGADFKNECAPNSLCKYFNLRAQVAIKSSEAEFRPGWVEYGLVQFENQTATPVLPVAISTQFGTLTLCQMLKNFFRGHCIWTGSAGLSVETPRVIDLHIKIPEKYCKNTRGSFWMFYLAFRSSKTTDTVTTIKTILSWEYKNYI